MASRVPPSQVLEHPFRQALLARIRATPGIAFLELYHHFKAVPEYAQGLGYGSLMYHLQQLERARHITTRKSGRFRRHYENGGPWNGDTTALALLQTPTAARLAQIVLGEPGLNQHGVWHRYQAGAPVTRQAVGYQLQRLIDLGLLVASKDRSATCYFGTEKLQRLMGFLTSRVPPASPIPSAVAADAIQAVSVQESAVLVPS